MKLTWRLSFSTFRMDRKQVQCLDCGKKLSSRDRLKQHMATQHSDNPPTFTCQCGKVFKSQIGLKSHEMLHTGGIKCGLCPFEGTERADEGALNMVLIGSSALNGCIRLACSEHNQISSAHLRSDQFFVRELGRLE